jgi:hypothetical protein
LGLDGFVNRFRPQVDPKLYKIKFIPVANRIMSVIDEPSNDENEMNISNEVKDKYNSKLNVLSTLEMNGEYSSYIIYVSVEKGSFPIYLISQEKFVEM